MNKPLHELEYSFRITDFEPSLFQTLEKYLSGLSIESREHKDTKKLVVAIPLTEGYNYQTLIEFIKLNNIPWSQYGIWVSLVTDLDQDGVHVPEFVTNIIREIGGNIDFSFTCV